MIVSRIGRSSITLIILVTAACGSPGAPIADRSTNEATSEATSAQTTAQTPTQTGQTTTTTKRKTVPTAPINIPPIYNKQGLPIDQVRSIVESEIRDACGDETLCVTVAVANGENDSFTRCQYDTSNPQSFSDQEQFTLDRGSTLTLLTGSKPCATTTETSGETPTDTSSESPGPSTPKQTSDVTPSP